MRGADGYASTGFFTWSLGRQDCLWGCGLEQGWSWVTGLFQELQLGPKSVGLLPELPVGMISTRWVPGQAGLPPDCDRVRLKAKSQLVLSFLSLAFLSHLTKKCLMLAFVLAD